MNQLKNLSFNELVENNDNQYNIPVEIILDEKYKVDIKVKPSKDVLDKVTEIYKDIYLAEIEQGTDVTKLEETTIQYFILGVLIKLTSSIEIEFKDTLGNYVQFIEQLNKANYLTDIIGAYEDDLDRIYSIVNENFIGLTKTLNVIKQQTLENVSETQQEKKQRKSRTSKPKVVN